MGLTMKKIIFIILLLSVYSIAQENRTVRQNDLADTLDANSRAWVNESDLTDSLDIIRASVAGVADSNFVLTSETSAWDKNASDDWNDSTFVYQAIDALPTVAETEGIVGDSSTVLKAYADEHLAGETLTKQTLADGQVPMWDKSIFSLQRTYTQEYINTNFVLKSDYSSLEASVDSLQRDLIDLEARVSALETSTPPAVPPLAPTDFEIHGTGTTTIAGSFTAPASVFDSVIVELRLYTLTDNSIYTRVAAIDSGTATFNLSSLDSSTVYEARAYSVKYSGSVANYSTYATSDTATTFNGEPQTPPSGTVIGQWFVDNSVVSSGNGLSYATAWKNFSNINWSNVQAGDTIIISGGTDTLTYAEEFEIGQDDVVIYKSPHTGHDGVVIIDGENTRQSCISNGAWNQFSDITIDGYDKDEFIITGFTLKGTDFRHEPNMTIRNITALLNNAGAEVAFYFYGTEWTGTPPFTAVNYLLENFSVLQDSGSYSGNQNSDGVTFYGTDSTTIRNGLIKLFNADNYPHQDMVQSSHSKNLTIENIEGYHYNAGATLNKQGIYITDCGGDIKILNNYIYLGQNAGGSAIAIEVYDNTWWTTYAPPDSFIVTNNTTVCAYDNPNAIRLVQSLSSTTFSANTFMKNNIFVKGTFAIDRKYFTSGSNCDYNNYYDASGVSIYDQPTNSTGTTRSWATWQGYGFDTHSIITNPTLTGYIPDAGSDAVDNGTNTSALGVTSDIIGTTRPVNSVFDIGCYEQ